MLSQAMNLIPLVLLLAPRSKTKGSVGKLEMYLYRHWRSWGGGATPLFHRHRLPQLWIELGSHSVLGKESEINLKNNCAQALLPVNLCSRSDRTLHERCYPNFSTLFSAKFMLPVKSESLSQHYISTTLFRRIIAGIDQRTASIQLFFCPLPNDSGNAFAVYCCDLFSCFPSSTPVR